jgi:DNA-binding SARP family transcriptional activator
MEDTSSLKISTLGGLSIRLAGEPVTGLASRKVEALLVYLACTGRTHPREVLAELFWEERAQTQAMANLRVALSSLRKHLEPYVTITREAVALDPEAEIWLDVAELERKLGAGETEEALALYRGDFLAGFYVRGCPSFEDWAAVERERLHHTVLDVLQDLVRSYIAQARYQEGITYAARMLQLDPLAESAHRQMMRLLAYSGQRGAALAQYETCRQLLQDELGVEPTAETTALYEQIQEGQLDGPLAAPAPVASPSVEVSPQLLAFLDADAEREEVERPVFVARERELERLDGFLETALTGEGQIAFVTGGPGRGKTALLHAFARRAQAAYPDLLVASGSCNAYSGAGDPYLPFRDVLGLLTGDVEARWAAGVMPRDHALRLWHNLPAAAEAVVARGPDLIDTFLPGAALVERAGAYAVAASEGAPNWLSQLRGLVERKAALPPDPNLQQSALFRQYTRVLAQVARQRPLLLLVDDLQWVDSGSVGLLFHVGRELAGCRVLILGAYRPEELALHRAEKRHPLENALAEFKRRFGDVWLDLSRADKTGGRHFVDALLDSEANRLGEGFRTALFHHTQGHPLFTAELLRTMQERGDLAQDAEGSWTVGPALNWEGLPPRVEGVIEERINRLESELREILTVASVEGEEFTAQVVARVQAADERGVIRLLSEALEKQHRLVSAQGIRWVDGLRLSLHRFQHNLFQKYLYNNLNEAERSYLHEDVGNALEALYADHPQELAAVAPQLARHFQEAGITGKAIDYLRRAGEWATRISANQEAITHFSQALALLEALPESLERAQTELILQVSLAVPELATKGWAAPEMARIVARARELCESVGESPLLFPVL